MTLVTSFLANRSFMPKQRLMTRKSLSLCGTLLVILAALDALPAHASSWTGGGANLNWSTPGNWADNGSPSGKSITFGNTAAAPIGTTTSIVDGNYTIGSLGVLPAFASGTDGQTLEIGPSHTLTVNGAMTLGSRANFGNFRTTYVTMKGGGHLVANGAVSMSVDNSGEVTGVVNLSGLGSFTGSSNSSFIVGLNNSSQMTLRLSAASNSITASSISVGSGGNSSPRDNRMELGAVNTLNANSLNVGTGRLNGWVGFQTGLAGDPIPEVVIRNRAGTGRATVLVGQIGVNSTSASGTLDFTGGTVDALFGTVTLGRTTAAANTGGTGTLTMSAGTVDATRIILGHTDSTGAGSLRATGVVNLNGGTMIAETLEFARDSSAVHDNVTGQFNMRGGTLRAESIIKGAGAGVVEFNWFGGTIANRAGVDLVVSSSIPLVMRSGSNFVFAPDAGRTITVNSRIQHNFATPGPLVLNGAGRLTLSASNSYTGATQISAGILEIGSTGRINTTSGITIDGAAAEFQYNSATPLSQPLTFTQGTLSGTGTIATAVTVGTNNVISPGNSPGIQAYTSLHAWAPGGTYQWEFNALTGSAGVNWDLVNVTSGTFNLSALSATPGGRFTLDLISLAAGDVAGQLVNPYDGGSYTFTIASYDPTNFLLPTGFSDMAGTDLTSLFTIDLGNWLGAKPQIGDVSVKINSTATGIDLVIVPEPGTLALAGIGIAAATWGWRRRRHAAAARRF
jgi:autotransporter-associated beta strand protein